MEFKLKHDPIYKKYVGEINLERLNLLPEDGYFKNVKTVKLTEKASKA